MWELQTFNILRCLGLVCLFFVVFWFCLFLLIMLKCLYWFLLTLAYLFTLVPLNLHYNSIKLTVQSCISYTQSMLFFSSSFSHKITTSLVTGSRRGLWRSSSPASCSKLLWVWQAFQELGQSSFEYLQGWSTHKLSGKFVLIFDHL